MNFLIVILTCCHAAFAFVHSTTWQEPSHHIQVRAPPSGYERLDSASTSASEPQLNSLAYEEAALAANEGGEKLEPGGYYYFKDCKPKERENQISQGHVSMEPVQDCLCVGFVVGQVIADKVRRPFWFFSKTVHLNFEARHLHLVTQRMREEGISMAKWPIRWSQQRDFWPKDRQPGWVLVWGGKIHPEGKLTLNELVKRLNSAGWNWVFKNRVSTLQLTETFNYEAYYKYLASVAASRTHTTVEDDGD